jgi:hypothetical protein
MNPDQITNTFVASEHQVVIYDKSGHYVLTLSRGAYFARSWPVGNYKKALAVAKRLIGLSSDQRDIMITEPQSALNKWKK